MGCRPFNQKLIANKKSFPIVATSREGGREFAKTRNYSDTGLEFAHASAMAALCLVEWGLGTMGYASADVRESFDRVCMPHPG